MLFVVSIPIGNPDDITLRALKILKEADLLVCEEFKIGVRFLRKLGIDKDPWPLNEHNEVQEVQEILSHLRLGLKVALFSDCGTPVFADPGTLLVKRCHEEGLPVSPVPGASSIMAALAVAGVPSESFYYAGFLSRKSEVRKKEIKGLNRISCPVILMDTPYRLKALLQDLSDELPSSRHISLLLSLTQTQEKIIKGTAASVMEASSKIQKQEFVIILDPTIVPLSFKKNKFPKNKNKK